MSGGGQPTAATAALLRPPRRPVVVRTKIGAVSGTRSLLDQPPRRERLLAVFAVAAGTKAIAGDEEAGTLDLAMAHPVRRVRVLLRLDRLRHRRLHRPPAVRHRRRRLRDGRGLS